MKLRRLFLLLSHLLVLAVGFGLGVYMLPILTAAPPPAAAEMAALEARQAFGATIRADLPGSDFLHWGEGTFHVATDGIAHKGRLAPGPDYKLYLSPEYVETGADFERVKAQSVRIGEVKSFKGFVLPIPAGVDISRYTTVVIWCETFSQFITAAKYREP